MSPLSKSMHQKSIENSPIDLRLKRISDDILPEAPYILTVPTTYRVKETQVNDWKRGCPFGADEEILQYMSFNARQHDDTILIAVGNWDDGHGALVDKMSANTSKSNSGTLSPFPGTAPRKKISLQDYSNRASRQVSVKAAPAVNGGNKVQEKVVAPVAAVVKEVQPKKEDPPHGRKRPAEPVAQDQPSKTINHEASPPPAKKPRISPEPPRMKPTRRPIPPLLSPTLHPTIEEALARKPSAGVVATEQAAPALHSSRNGPHTAILPSKETNTVYSKGGTSAPKNTILSAKPKPLNPLSGTPRPKPRSSPPHNIDRNPKTNGVVSARPQSNDRSGKNKDETVDSTGPNSVTEQPENKSLLVKLKIPKSARKNLTRIVGLRQGPKKNDTTVAPDQGGSGFPTKGLPTKNHYGDKTVQSQHESDVSKAGEKRKRPEEKGEGEPLNKRQKPAAVSGGSIHKTHTPARTLMRSPATGGVVQKPPTPATAMKSPSGAIVHKPHTPLRSKTPSRKSPAPSQQGSGHKTAMPTPKRDLKATAMRRITSAEGNVQTPSGGTRNGTPTAPFSAERATRDVRATLNASANTMTPEKTAESAEWRAEQRRYLELGRSRKHDADAILNRTSKSASLSREDLVAKNQGIALAIETVLCYMLAFCLGDESCRLGRNRVPGDIATWRSLLGYMHFVIGLVEPISHLHGLCLHLEAVCRETIHQYELERLDRDPLPSAGSDESRSSPPKHDADPSASDAATKAANARRDFADFKTKLVENSRLAQQAWLTGNSRLPCDELQQSYPKTWGRRAKAPCDAKGKERLVMRKYNGGFYLPLGSTSSGIEAVRMGWSFLGEWCAKEGVRWEGKMGL